MSTRIVERVYPVVAEGEFPHGIMCPECGRIILPGQPYAKKPTGVTDGVFMLRLQCVYCP